MSYTVKLKSFEGPMDLLYHLIEKNKIDIYDIPIYEITEQYLEYLDEIRDLNLGVTSEFILMASTLLEIKSKMLLPKTELQKEEDDPREDLVKRIIEYKKYRLASDELKERNSVYSKLYYKLKEDVLIEEDDLELDGLDIDMLLESYKKVVLRYERQKAREKELEREEDELVQRVQRDGISIEESMDKIRDRLEVQGSIKMLEAFELMGELDKNKIVTAFLAILELIKRKELTFYQDESFGEVVIKWRVEEI